MQTLKTAVVVVLLLVVFYGVYEMLNRPPDAPPADVAVFEDMPFDPPEVQFGEAAGSPRAEPAISVPTVTSNGPVESPVPSDTMAPSEHPGLARFALRPEFSGLPPPPAFATDQRPAETEHSRDGGAAEFRGA